MIDRIIGEEPPEVDNMCSVIIFSGCEEKGAHYGYSITLAKQLAKKLAVPIIFIMASQSTLVSPWLEFVKDGIDDIVHLCIPQSMKDDQLCRRTLEQLKPVRYNLVCPQALNLHPMTNWESALFKLVRVQSVRLLEHGGCLIVKCLDKTQCFKLALCYAKWHRQMDDDMEEVSLGIRSIPYTETRENSLQVVGFGKKVVLWCTDVVTYGHNIKNCRGVVSCGLRKVVRYHKTFGVRVLIPMPMSRENALQLYGRINREGENLGAAFTVLPWDSQYRTERDEVGIARDEGLMLELLAQRMKSVRTMFQLQNINICEMPGLTSRADVAYCWNLLNINYALVHGGPSSYPVLKSLMEWVGRKLNHAPVRWRFLAHTIFLIYCNKFDDTVRCIVQVSESEKHRAALHRVLLYVAFCEGEDEWIMSASEAQWLKYTNERDRSQAALSEIQQDKVNVVAPRYAEYGGEGYRSMNFLNKWLSVTVTRGSGQNRLVEIKWFESKKWWRPVMHERTIKRNLTLIGNLIFQMCYGRLGPPIRGATRLTCMHRWDSIENVELCQLVLCNTRPLQVARLCVDEEEQKEKTEKGATRLAQTIVTNEVVCFVDDYLIWDDLKKWEGYCECSSQDQQKVRYIYFGGVMKKRTKEKGMEGLFEVRDTMAIAHVIGCLLEKWFFKTKMVVKEKKVAVDVVRTRRDRENGLEGEAKAMYLDAEEFKKAVGSKFETECKPYLDVV